MMVEARLPYRGLVLLGQAFRAQSSGLLSVGRGPSELGLVMRGGHIAAVVFPEDKAPAPPSGPDDSAQLRLDRVLSEIGIRPPSPKGSRRTARNLRERMLSALLDTDAAPFFEDGAFPAGAVEVAGATEPLVLEAIRRVPDPQAVRDALGDLEQRVVAATSLADERTLTLTEGYILSRVDGRATAREVLQLVPLEPEETERTLLGLLLTGRLEYRPVEKAPTPAATAAGAPTAAIAPERAKESPESVGESLASPGGEGEAPAGVETEPSPHATPTARGDAVEPGDPLPSGLPAADTTERAPAAAAERPTVDAPADETTPSPGPAAGPEPAPADAPVAASPVAAGDDSPADDAGAPPAAPPRPEIDHETLQRRREVVEYFQALPAKNHFDVLGVEPGCTDAEVKRAYAALARKYHPDAHRRAGLDDLHDVLQAIFIRIGEAWEVLGDARSRASYEARFPPGIRRRAPSPAAASGSAAPAPSVGPPAPADDDEPEAQFGAREETITKAQLLLTQARYWDAIQMLEANLPHMPPSRQQRRGRILLARAYAKNPNWLRKAEDALQQVVREDPANADAHYELGLIYKTGGMMARAQASFRRALDLRPDHREAAAELAPTDAPGRSGGLLRKIFGRGKAS